MAKTNETEPTSAPSAEPIEVTATAQPVPEEAAPPSEIVEAEVVTGDADGPAGTTEASSDQAAGASPDQPTGTSPDQPTWGAPPASFTAAEPEPRKRRRSWKWLWITLASLAAAALIALSVYLIVVTNDWREYSAELEAQLDDVKATAAQDRANYLAVQERVTTVQGQLDTANARITELANEEANATDTQDALRDHIEAMISCADQRQEIINVLTNSNLYFPGKSNQQVENETTEYCDTVKADYQTYLSANS